MKILFVCTGNTCRSPMAEAAWRSLPAELAVLAQVSSAGLMAHKRDKAAANSIVIARDWGIDLTAHRARRIDEEMLAKSDLIVTMTSEAAEVIRECFPGEAAKVRVLGEFAQYATDAAAHEKEVRQVADLIGVDAAQIETLEIDDPFGGTLEEYKLAGAQIRRAVEGLAVAIQRGEVTTS